MQTRKDLYQAHRLMTQRLGMALLQGEPDVSESPMRRQNIAMFSGVLVAVLVAAAFGIWGMLKPGNATNLTDAGQLLVEEETGAKFVYSQQDSRLLPVANYVSARLLLDAGDVKTRKVSAASLAGFSRGPMVGIPGAPDSLPTKDQLVKGPWSACVSEMTGPAGDVKQFVTLVGGISVGGAPVAGGALVVKDDQQQGWIIWANQRMRIGPEGVQALGAAGIRKVPSSWLNAIPAGPKDFVAPSIASRGKVVAGPAGGRARVGQIFTAAGIAGAADSWYVLLDDGLAPISVTQARLLWQDKRTKLAYGKLPVEPIKIDAATANAHLSRQQILGGGLPPTLPKLITPGTSAPLCAVYANTQAGSAKATLTVGTLAIPVPRTMGNQERFDQVLLPPGRAALAGLLPGDGQLSAISTYDIISDQGRRFPLIAADQIEKLGYDATDVAPVPAHLLHLIPQGPALDPTKARTPVDITQ
ncbi:type VII secretion protein EccB [Nonomuraea sediminis]|uniref:type VII secretion protein EccB n=1 Tax=Nonomuraea sediminis TaxID=2835864 RepID=UPI001BDC80D2|nr:type VII secretion protein EccB [Nonomuraea sediminis]